MRYCVNRNAQPGAEHEVHTFNCPLGPGEVNGQYLGEYSSCAPAVQEAKRFYPNSDGCYFCCNECHTR
ncbi:MAG: hypothetical protein JWR84_3693 [Caulobacter sp.]|nr:hypothetical protein [Caulobacter sp.]